MALVTKKCAQCGEEMHNVYHSKRYCPRCMKERANEISRAYYEKHKNDKPKPERPKRRKIYKKKSLSRCALEAYMLNMSYGNYVAQGLDKEEVDIEL